MDITSAFDTMQATSMATLQSVGITQLWENDPRSLFVLDLELESSAPPDLILQPVYCNRALRKFPGLQEAICTNNDLATTSSFGEESMSYTEFQQWARGKQDPRNIGVYPIAAYRGMIWDLITINERWNVISARLSHRPYVKHFGGTAGSNLGGVAKKRPAPLIPASHNIEFLNYEAARQIDGCMFDGKLASGQDRAAIREPLQQYHALTTEVRALRQEVEQKNAFINRLAKIEGVAIFVFDENSEPIWCNDKWYQLLGVERGVSSGLSRINAVIEEDQALLYQHYTRFRKEKVPMVWEVRIKTPWSPPFHVEGEPAVGPTWLKTYVYPQLSDDGVLTGTSGFYLDISEMKWLECVQQLKREEALQQERARLAAEQQELLVAKQMETDAIESRFSRLADILPIGVYVIDKDRVPKYRNEAYYRNFRLNIPKPGSPIEVTSIVHVQNC